MNLSIHLNESDGSRNKTNLAYNYIVSFDNEATDRQAEEEKRREEEEQPI